MSILKRAMGYILSTVFCASLIGTMAFADDSTEYVIRSSASPGGELTYYGVHRVTQGEDITYNIIPENNFEIVDVIVDGVSVGAVRSYTFEDINSNHFIRVEFKIRGWELTIGEKKPHYRNWYNDIRVSDWFYDSAVKAADMRWFIDNSHEFNDDKALTRGELAVFLHNISMNPIGNDKGAYDIDINDIEKYSNLYKAVVWCIDQHYFGLNGDGNFRPDEPVTRQEFAAIMWVYSGNQKFGEDAISEDDVFKDENMISDRFEDAMSWAVYTGVYTGKTGYILDPCADMTRAEAVTAMYRFMTNVYEYM